MAAAHLNSSHSMEVLIFLIDIQGIMISADRGRIALLYLDRHDLALFFIHNAGTKLTAGILAPGHYRSVGTQRGRAVAAGSQPHYRVKVGIIINTIIHIADPNHRILIRAVAVAQLAVFIIPPAVDIAVLSQDQDMVSSGHNLDRLSVVKGLGAYLAGSTIGTPVPHAAILIYSRTKINASRDMYYIIQRTAGGLIHLDRIDSIFAPGPNGTIRLQSQGQGIPCLQHGRRYHRHVLRALLLHCHHQPGGIARGGISGGDHRPTIMGILIRTSHSVSCDQPIAYRH